MTTFIFMLDTQPSPTAVERILTELTAAFPQHEFIAGDASTIGYEYSILAIHETDGGVDEVGAAVDPDADDVSNVATVFADLLTGLLTWKPS